MAQLRISSMIKPGLLPAIVATLGGGRGEGGGGRRGENICTTSLSLLPGYSVPTMHAYIC